MANFPTQNHTMSRKILMKKPAAWISAKRRSILSMKEWNCMNLSQTRKICPKIPHNSFKECTNKECCQRDQWIAWRTSGSAICQKLWKSSLLNVCMRELISALVSKKFQTPISKNALDNSMNKNSLNWRLFPRQTTANWNLVVLMLKITLILELLGIHQLIKTISMIAYHPERTATFRILFSKP